jgi:hypothetical protein
MPSAQTSLFVALLDSSPVVASPPSDQPGPPGWLPRDTHALAGHVHQAIAYRLLKVVGRPPFHLGRQLVQQVDGCTPRDRSGREAQSTSGVPSST